MSNNNEENRTEAGGSMEKVNGVGSEYVGSPTSDIPKDCEEILDQLVAATRLHHFSNLTQEVYRNWVYRYHKFHGFRKPAELRAPDIAQFMSYLTTECEVAVAARHQAHGALIFLYKYVIGITPEELDQMVVANHECAQP